MLGFLPNITYFYFIEHFAAISHSQAILVQISRVNAEEYGTKVDTLRYSPVNIVSRTVQKVCTVQFQVYFRVQWQHPNQLGDYLCILKYRFRKYLNFHILRNNVDLTNMQHNRTYISLNFKRMFMSMTFHQIVIN